MSPGQGQLKPHALLAVLLLATALNACRPRQHQPAALADGGPASVKIIYPAAPRSFVKLVKRAARWVVHLQTDGAVRNGPADWLPPPPEALGPINAQWVRRSRQALGSGILLDKSGTIITNAHLVSDRSVWVRFSGSAKAVAAKIVGHDPRTDIAVLSATPPEDSDAKPAKLGRSSDLSLGEWAFAVGNPFGYGPQVTAGIVSMLPTKETPISTHGYLGYIHTTARINAANSGGPLINMLGEVVGLNTAIQNDETDHGLALPIDVARELLPALKKDGRIARVRVGMYVDQAPEALRKRIATALKSDKSIAGAVVTQVEDKGPAALAGLRRGDVILRIDGQAVSDASQLAWRITTAGLGHALTVEVWRDGQRHSFTLQPQPMPE
ncbi:MAG: trypsin-like peptidase domain-containing protein [Deltaproteobacteria bacterium]|nr:trypsin-like peptidase domain-containing protein [Deltaproteobacteria bacterium]